MKKHETTTGHSHIVSRLSCKRAAYIFLNLFVMLFPGIVLDILYRFHDSFKGLRQFISLSGITYSGAFTILGGHAGMLMTMVSLFLTMNIQIAERSEKKVYGISRKELRKLEHEQLYISVERMAYVAPPLFLVFLNLYFCFTGYLVLFYCYLFLFIYYYKHRSSYGVEWNRTAVIRKLAGCLYSEERDSEQILQYRLLLENIGKSAEEDSSWLEMETLYYQLLGFQDYDNEKRYIIGYYFFSIVFLKHNKNWVISIQMLKRYMTEADRESAEKDGMPDSRWPVLWGMLKAVFCEADEEHLSIFLQWFLDFHERSNAAFQAAGKTLPIAVLKEQSGMLLVLSEHRLRLNGLHSFRLEKQMQAVRDYGKVTVQCGTYQCLSQIRMLNKLEDAGVIEEVITELEDDYRNHCRRCIITNL